MAARGSILKTEIANKIIQTFPNSFLYNDGKEIRINGVEDGNPIQIKVALTAAKTAVEPENDVINFTDSTNVINNDSVVVSTTSEKVPQEPSQEEKDRLAELLSKLGL